jgi:hypothetical protein
MQKVFINNKILKNEIVQSFIGCFRSNWFLFL